MITREAIGWRRSPPWRSMPKHPVAGIETMDAASDGDEAFNNGSEHARPCRDQYQRSRSSECRHGHAGHRCGGLCESEGTHIQTNGINEICTSMLIDTEIVSA